MRTLSAPTRERLVALSPAAVVLLAPLVGVLVVRAPLMNNLAYRDPWFYSGYAWTLAHHVEIFGWFYYSVRFPVDPADPLGDRSVRPGDRLHPPALPDSRRDRRCALRVFPPLHVGGGRMYRGRAAGDELLLLRMVLWDYTSFVAVPCSIAGAAIWFMASVRGRVLWQFVAAGALLGAAVFANALSASVVGALLLVEGIAALRNGPREILRLAVRCLSALAGALLVFVAATSRIALTSARSALARL